MEILSLAVKNIQVNLAALNLSRLQATLLWEPKGSAVATDAHLASALSITKASFFYIRSLRFDFLLAYSYLCNI